MEEKENINKNKYCEYCQLEVKKCKDPTHKEDNSKRKHKNK